uniref:Uncharacterized protein n=1 Tax=Panagrolaimus sp. PS1159 TaxID=55785 RepID=A0AC35FBF6_9BILA
MKGFFGCFLFALIAFYSTNAQLAAWPATSYSPYFDALFKAASSPVLAAPSGQGMQAPAIPVPAPIPVPYAAPVYTPFAAPVFATPLIPSYAPLPYGRSYAFARG